MRDRRWCQGNLQHAAVLPARGLHWVSRMHLLTGIGSYITAPLWLLFLLTGILISLQARFIPPDYFPAGGKSLFPHWPVIDPVRAMWVFIGTMALLLVPKLLGYDRDAVRRDRRGAAAAAACGLLVSLLLETLIAGLIAPVVMLTQSIDVVAILLRPRFRLERAAPRRRRRAVARHRPRCIAATPLLGLLLGDGAWAVSPYLALWMLPVVLGLALAVPLAALTGRRSWGLALRRMGLLRIPEEGQPPEVLRRTAILYRQALEKPAADSVPALLNDPILLAAHRQMLPPRAGRGSIR